ncbi:MAG: hypothetical protein MZV70_52465 [Desulfobacterales bacterium]|nr:hypothetical protein [Desulfobacterales bacterium]
MILCSEIILDGIRTKKEESGTTLYLKLEDANAFGKLFQKKDGGTSSKDKKQINKFNKERSNTMRTKEQYIAGLRKMRRNIYHDGEKIDRDDEIQASGPQRDGYYLRCGQRSGVEGSVHSHIALDGRDASTASAMSIRARRIFTRSRT